MFYYHLGLHYSQTVRLLQPAPLRVLLPLGITLLSNRAELIFERSHVLLPLGITLLSNSTQICNFSKKVLLPLGITLLSNFFSIGLLPLTVLLPLGITLLSNTAITAIRFLNVLLPLGITLLSNLKFQNGRYFVLKNGKTRRFPTVWSSTPTLQQSIRRQQNDYST